jgi:hypothetical protein
VNAVLEYYASVLSHLQFQSVSNYIRDHKSIYTVALISHGHICGVHNDVVTQNIMS